MTITLTPRETARLIVDRANELQELVNQKCEPKHRDIWRAALRTLENRIWEAVNHLNDITNLCGVGESSKPEGAPIPPEGEVPVTQAKDEEVIAIDQKDATSLPKTASEVEAETERLVRNAQEYQQTARRVLKEVRKDEEAIAIDQEAACHSIYTLTTELSHLASAHEEGRSIPEDANKAVGILGELIKNVTTLYRIKWELV